MKRFNLDIQAISFVFDNKIQRVAIVLGIGLMMPGFAAQALTSSDDGSISAEINAPYVLAQTTTPTTADPATADPATTDPASSSSQGTARFTCQFQNGEYQVMYLPESQPGKSYPWAAPGNMGGGWSAERRCIEISRRLEDYRPDGLQELQTSTENGYNTVCATTEQDPFCRIVFTVPDGQDPSLTRDLVFENLAVANSGQDTNAVNTLTGNDGLQILDTISRDLGFDLPAIPGVENPTSNRTDNINLRPFLDPADGGTGLQLRSSEPALLNPDDFR